MARGMRRDIDDPSLTSVERNLPGTSRTSVTVVGRAIPAGAASTAIVLGPPLPIALEILVAFSVSISVASFEVWLGRLEEGKCECGPEAGLTG